MKNKENLFFISIIAAVVLLSIKTLYERKHPLILHGKKARYIAISSTGRDINSPVSYLFGRAPYFIICDKLKGTYKSIPNKYKDAQHAAGLRASLMIAKKKVDAVCGNNIGFEPAKVFSKENIEIYTNVKGTVLQTLQAYPDGLVKINEQNVPSHFGITGSMKPIQCSSFDAQANVTEVVQGKIYMCFDCGYKISATKVSKKNFTLCPSCGKNLHEIITVTAPATPGNVKPKVRVF
jgi:predicted Fe-Mo cluster-binding NifX family protein